MCKHDHGAPMVTARTACAPPRTASASAQRHKGDVVAPIPSPLGGLGACCRQPPHRSSLATIVMNNTQRPTVNTRVCVCRCVHFSSPHTFRVYFHKRPLQQGLHLATHSTYTCTCTGTYLTQEADAHSNKGYTYRFFAAHLGSAPGAAVRPLLPADGWTGWTGPYALARMFFLFVIPCTVQSLRPDRNRNESSRGQPEPVPVTCQSWGQRTMPCYTKANMAHSNQYQFQYHRQ